VAPVRVGTCSFADEALTKHFYPRGVRTGAERLRYYAGLFDTVEIDSSFYTLPASEHAERWARATPDGFVFHVKAFAPMTRHPVRLEQLPADVRTALEADERGRVDRLPREVREELFGRFRQAVEPLRRAGKLGGVLMQYPPYVVPKPASWDELAWAREQLAGLDMLVEFRHQAWLADDLRDRTLATLEDLGAIYVAVDAPRTGGRNVLPTIVTRTGPMAYVRMHGRNARTWNVRGKGAAERFDYLYSEDELAEWVEPLRNLAEGAEQVFVLFNTNNRSPGVRRTLDLGLLEHESDADHEWIAQGPENAVTLRRLLQHAGVPVTDSVKENSPR
jgi:uncharacterized protein YecE (DUF72 family)